MRRREVGIGRIYVLPPRAPPNLSLFRDTDPYPSEPPTFLRARSAVRSLTPSSHSILQNFTNRETNPVLHISDRMAITISQSHTALSLVLSEAHIAVQYVSNTPLQCISGWSQQLQPEYLAINSSFTTE